jgi:hypothetical protein
MAKPKGSDHFSPDELLKVGTVPPQARPICAVAPWRFGRAFAVPWALVVALQTTPPLLQSQLFPWLSRACLGKMIMFIYIICSVTKEAFFRTVQLNGRTQLGAIPLKFQFGSRGATIPLPSGLHSSMCCVLYQAGGVAAVCGACVAQ